MVSWEWVVLAVCLTVASTQGAAAEESSVAYPSTGDVTGSAELAESPAESSSSSSSSDVVDGDVLAGYLVGISAIICVALSMLLGAVIYALTRKIRKIRKERRRQSYLHGNDVDLDESLVDIGRVLVA
eukprot:TRINITY_DN9877_c0_g1_i1.p1 TRINITY_DN9877_c0_g1~~TRINITY_DN9877_c0_g1_i1.p1  ORF type:complete len:128 (-),score=14.17 TRINITY_DN9877_c0_g1_i1:94-477(-)